MRYEKGHKDATRERIVEVASRQFREHGVAAVGLAAIMADAGLTNGAFYAHFGSKEDLVREVLVRTQSGRRAALLSKSGQDGSVEGMVRAYLSQAHRDNPGGGCPTAALAPDIARRPRATRNAYTENIGNFISLMAERLPAGTEAARRRKATAIYSMMVGALQLARAVSDKALSDEILASGIAAAVALIGESSEQAGHRAADRAGF